MLYSCIRMATVGTKGWNFRWPLERLFLATVDYVTIGILAADKLTMTCSRVWSPGSVI